MATQDDVKKLEPKVAWLFAGAAIVCGIAVSFGLKTASWKVLDAVYSVLFVGLAGASTYLTTASAPSVVGRFAAAGSVLGVFTIWFVHHGLANGEGMGLIPTLPGLESLFSAIAKVGATPLAIVMGVFMFLLVTVTGLAGAVIGSRLRAGKGYGLIPARR